MRIASYLQGMEPKTGDEKLNTGVSETQGYFHFPR